MNIEIATSKDRSLWDALVDGSPHGSIFHRWHWLKLVEKHSDMTLIPLMFFKGTEPIGIFPLYFKKKKFLKFIFSPPPGHALPFMGPIVKGYDLLKQNKKESFLHGLVNSAITYISSEIGFDYFYVITPPNLLDVRPFVWGGFDVQPSYNYFFDLSLGINKLWNGIRRHTRKNIKKAKEKIKIFDGSKEDLKQIYYQLERRYQEQNRKFNLELSFLIDAYDNFTENFDILVAEYEGSAVGGLINLKYRNKVVYSWIGNAKVNIPGVYPNDLLIWESLEKSHRGGFLQFFEIGANTPRLVEYKSNFNPELVINFNIEKSKIPLRLAKRIYYKYFRKYRVLGIL